MGPVFRAGSAFPAVGGGAAGGPCVRSGGAAGPGRAPLQGPRGFTLSLPVPEDLSSEEREELLDIRRRKKELIDDIEVN